MAGSSVAVSTCMYVMYLCMVITYSKNKDTPGKVVSPPRGQLHRENYISLSAFAPENLVSRDGFGSPIPRQPAHVHTQTEYGAYSRDSSQIPRRRPFILLKPPYAIGSVPCLCIGSRNCVPMAFTAESPPAQGP